MKLTNLLTTGQQIRTNSKVEKPGLPGELETLKARLWMRLLAIEDIIILAEPASAGGQAFSGNLHKRCCHRASRPDSSVTGLSGITLCRLQREGRFPRHRQISNRTVGWMDTEIYEWDRERFGNGDGPRGEEVSR